MGNFRAHNHETGMVHSHKSQRPRRKFISSDDDDDYTDKDYSVADESNQLVLYDPQTKHHKQRKTKHHKQREVHFTEPIDHSTPLQQRFPKARQGLPAIGYYTVQCANCFKWRIVPTKEKYEELRETITEELFVCARASEWNRVLSCDDQEDMPQDTSKVWTIDKPEIPQPPPGWDREVRIRGEGCSRYYTSPSGTTLRSMVEIGRYLAENPYYIQQGVNLSQFSMLTPQPLQKDYIRKRNYSATRQLREPYLEHPVEVRPLACAPPPTREELLRMGTSASNPVDLDESEVYDAPPLRTRERTPWQASPSSSEHTRSTLTAASSSGGPTKRTLKQVSIIEAPPNTSTQLVTHRSPASRVLERHRARGAVNSEAIASFLPVGLGFFCRQRTSTRGVPG